jgi:hypothetical protein
MRCDYNQASVVCSFVLLIDEYLVNNTVAAKHVARFSRNSQRLNSIIALDLKHAATIIIT